MTEIINQYHQEEIDVMNSLPDGKEYYEYIINNVEIDRNNPKNSYIMYQAGKVDYLDTDMPCLFTKASTALPDIDVDFPTTYREKSIEYVKSKYGNDKVCQITTFGRLSGRSAIKAVMRVKGIYDFETMNTVTENIPDEAAISDQLEDTHEDSIISFLLHHDPDTISDYARIENGEIVGDFAEVFKEAIAIEGIFQNKGKHAAGVIISSEKISDEVPMTLARDGSVIADLDMGDLEKIGLVKFDFLGVDILNKIQEAYGPDIVNVGLDDKESWDVLKDGNTKGCFQLESKLGREWTKEIKPNSIEELAAVISVLRPGTLLARSEDGRSMTKVYADRANGLEPVPDNAITNIIDTKGILIYQETLLNIAKNLAGFNSADSIALMKSVGKKDAKKLYSLEEAFISGCNRIGIITEHEAKALFDNIKSSARYAFNKCLSPNTLAETPYGFFTLDELVIGDIIKTPDGYSKVLNKYESGQKELFEVTLDNGFAIECSLEHKFKCEDGQILPLWQIIEEDLKILCDSDD